MAAAVFSAVKTEYPDDVSSSFHVGSSFGDTVVSGTTVNGRHPSDVDEDEIVREIDVYISPALSQELHLIQYPLTPAAVAADAPKSTTRYNPVAARYKPRNQMMELDFVVNHDSFATLKRPNGIPYGFDLKQRTYGSTSIDLVTHTAVGIMSPKGDSMHLIPLLHPTKQMRPSFQHIDDINADRNEDTSSNAKEARSKHNNNGLDEELDGMGEQPILLQKKESDKTIAIRQSSYAYKKALQAAEEWIELQVQTDRVSRNAIQNKRREAYCSNPTRILRLAPGVAGQKAYISTLNYLPVSLEDVDRISSTVLAAAPASPGTEEEGQHPTHEEQHKVLLRELTAKLTTTLQRGLPIPISMIEHRYPDIDSRLLLTSLLGCAVLVRGNFIIKSSLWGLSPVEQDARDAIIWILNKYGHIQRHRLLPWIAAAQSNSTEEKPPNLPDINYFDTAESTQQPTPLKEEAINHIVMSMCRKVENGWECRLEDDDTLATRFPLVAVAYGNYWAFRQNQIQKYLDLYEQNDET